MLIKRTQSSDPLPSEITPESIYLQRRQFMLGGLGVAAGLAAGGVSAAIEGKMKNRLGDLSKLPDSAFNTDEELTPYKSVTTYNNFYELGYGKADPHENAERLKTDPWTIKVGGLCEKPATYQLEDFVSGVKLEDRVYRLRCVEAWSMVIPWVGFPIAEVIKRAKPLSNAKYVAFATVLDPENLPGQKRKVLEWPYREGLRIDEAANPLAIFAVGLYGKELPNQNGAPLRLVIPWKYGFKSAKSIVEMTFTEAEPPTAWNTQTPHEYGFYSNVNPDVSHPRWSQARERRIGEFRKRKTLPFNGYAEHVAHMYAGMDLAKYF